MTTPPTDSETLNVVNNALSTRYLRRVLQYLINTEDGVASVKDLADHFADQKNTSTDRERIRVRMHHVALPKLAAMGLIDYDYRSSMARYREHSMLERVLQETVEAGV